MQNYDHRKIEKKWRKHWKDKKIYRQELKKGKKKSYVLDMFPYPSGEGLHVGHPKGYIATDIYSRYKKMKGFNILHPMGWDAFGLPAENFAIKNKIHPKIAVDKNIKRYKEQLSILGFNYDWSREINTTDPKYYKWTQWIFLQMLEKGLAYQSYEPINWCPSCQTGLANEDLDGDKCERCGSVVEKKPMRQWVLKITDYAERLLKDLESLDWPESIKESQRNWIGKSEGAEIDFLLTNSHKEIFLATSNKGKIERFKKLIKEAKIDVKVHTPESLNIPEQDVPEKGKTLKENAELKARAYFGKVKMPILANDTGIWVKGEGFVDAPKRKALGNAKSEEKLTKEFISKKLLDFWKSVAKKHGGNVDAEWHETFVLLDEKGKVTSADSKREIILTDKEFGKPHIQMPVRCLYYSKTTDKPAIKHTVKEELLEMKPIIDAIKTLVSPSIKVFTTRPDTIFGTTYLVLSPEHKEISNYKHQITNWEEVRKYIEETKNKTEIERTAEGKEKTGVELKGVKAINPANGEEIPVWIADYVLADYGTGAIMAVPAHDERDFEFAKKYNLPIRQVVAPYVVVTGQDAPRSEDNIVCFNAATAILKHWSENKYYVIAFNSSHHGLIGGSLEPGENAKGAIVRETTEESGYTEIGAVEELFENAYSRGYKTRKSREELCTDTVFVVELTGEGRIDIVDEKTKEGSWMTAEDILKLPTFIDHHKLYFEHYLHQKPFSGNGRLVNSGEFDGEMSGEAKDAITAKFGTKKITYKIKDWVFSRQRYWGEPIPIIYCRKCWEITNHKSQITNKSQIQNKKLQKEIDYTMIDGIEYMIVPVPEKDLPVTLPKVKNYEPTGTGESPLANIEKWVNVKCPKCKGKAKRETNTMPQWAGSCWYYIAYCISENSKSKALNSKQILNLKSQKSKQEINQWLPVDVYVGGAEHATRHLIYARFWHKFLYDIKAISKKEPFQNYRNVGLILAQDGKKMSKRYGNVINPDDVVKTWGADTLRVYEMFMGPFGQAISWSTDNMIGSRRFLEKVWRLKQKVKSEKLKVKSLEIESLVNETIKKVSEDIENFNFNTAISSLMILSNELDKEEDIQKTHYESLLKLLSPFAPHITEEIWQEIGNKFSIHTPAWPVYKKINIKKTVKIAVQINGKVREVLEVEEGESEELITKKALAKEAILSRLKDKKIKKIIYIKDKILSIVLE